VNAGLSKRYRRERRFRLYGISAILASLLFLSFLFGSIISKGYSAFQQTFIRLDIFFDPAILSQDSLTTANYPGVVKQSLRQMFPEVTGARTNACSMAWSATGPPFRFASWCWIPRK
jgi:phosphate transport system permease protein